LRFILIHSTEGAFLLSFQQSPFNVGLSLDLSAFSWKQVEALTHRYQVEPTEELTASVPGKFFLWLAAIPI
jgi:hypothetical protein